MASSLESIELKQEVPNTDTLPKQEPELHICRICFGIHDELILPCNCITTRVHRSCLDTWRSEHVGKSFTRCEVCQFDYVLEELDEEELKDKSSCCSSNGARYMLRMTLEIVTALSVIFGSFFVFLIIFHLADPTQPWSVAGWWALGIWATLVNMFGCAWGIANGRSFSCDDNNGHHSDGCGGGNGNCIVCFCPSNNHDCSSGSGSGHNSGEACIAMFVAAVIMCAVSAVFVGFYFLALWIDDAAQKHSAILGRYQETDRWRVVDQAKHSEV